MTTGRLIEGLEEDVARRFVTLYERTTHITGVICTLGKVIEALSLQNSSEDIELYYLGSIVKEKGREIDTLLDSFASYPTVYLELKEKP